LPLHKKTLIVRVIIALLIIGGCAFTIYYLFFLRFARVPGSSMANTIIPGDRVVMNKLFGQIDRGQLVVFQYPDDSTYYICRVIGLPGETIQVRGNMVYVNERPLDEQRVLANALDPQEALKETSTEGNGPYSVYYTEHFQDPSFRGAGDFGVNSPFQIPDNTFFLMGDNRDNSEDSRHRGPVPRDFIWGRVSLVYYSEAETPDGSIRWERIFKKVR
jgi:signal peptidase I